MEKKEMRKKARKGRGIDVQSMKGEGWFYTDEVKEHFFRPKNFMDGKGEKKYKADGIGMVGSPACVDNQTLIHSDIGLLPIKELASENKILSHDGEYNMITKVYKPEYNGKLVIIKNQLGKIISTEDHLIYAIVIPDKLRYAHNKDKRKFPISWVHAGSLEKGDICLYPLPNEVDNNKYIEITYEKKKFDFNSKTIPNKIQITGDLLRLFGYFIAEGSTRKRNDKSSIMFCFGSREMNLAEDVKRIVMEIFNLDCKIKEDKSNNRITVEINSVHLARFLRVNFGEGCFNKKIPDFLLYLDKELQKELIYGIWKGDGYISINPRKPRAEFSTTSEILTQHLKILLLRQKIQHSIYSEKEIIRKGVKHKECYRIHIGEYAALKKMAEIMKINFNYPNFCRKAIHSWFDNDYYYIPIRKISKGSFNGRLSNLEVDKTHSYVSNAFILHNCGDVMKVWIKVNGKEDRIVDMRWRTFGCASAIAATSMLSVMVSEKKGMKIDEAMKIKPQDIVARLGSLPARKFHCSVLGDKALRAAVNDYFRRSGQTKRIVVEGARVIDKETGTTDKDIEEAVLEGADTFEKLQHKLKVGISNKACIPEVEQLIRFYKEKYFG